MMNANLNIISAGERDRFFVYPPTSKQISMNHLRLIQKESLVLGGGRGGAR